MTDPLKIETEAYSLWLQAGKPPFELFMALAPALQDHLADIGNVNTIERILATARAIHDPDLFELQHYGTAEETEEYLTARMSEQALEHLFPRGPQTPSTAPGSESTRTMSGALKAREEDDEARRVAAGRARRFLGRIPDQFRSGTPVPEPHSMADEEDARERQGPHDPRVSR